MLFIDVPPVFDSKNVSCNQLTRRKLFDLDLFISYENSSRSSPTFLQHLIFYRYEIASINTKILVCNEQVFYTRMDSDICLLAVYFHRNRTKVNVPNKQYRKRKYST